MRKHIIAGIFITLATGAGAQVYISDDGDEDFLGYVEEFEEAADSLIDVPLPASFFLPATYMPYSVIETPVLAPASPMKSGDKSLLWLEREHRAFLLATAARQHHALTRPQDVRYIFRHLPKAPEAVQITVEDPSNISVNIGEIKAEVNPQVQQVDVNRQHWINKLGINLQFSQAYISPNWYQGGTSSMNLIADFTYNTKINDKFHPKLLFENFFQWRTALTSSPDDDFRNYTITENRLQINSKFGYKATNKWYYTLTGLFKTPIFNNYKNNTDELTASFLSPGELNFGLGMTFNTKNKPGTLTFNATIAPLSYNLKTVRHREMNPQSYGIKKGRSQNSFGSNTELVLNWKMGYNVNWRSRLFFFTNYEYSQADWQNQFQFTINRYLTANLNVDMRYDTSIKKAKRDEKWGLLQLRELISLGFTYNISH